MHKAPSSFNCKPSGPLITTKGTSFVVCAVCGLPVFSSTMTSALPWSAVRSIVTPFSLHLAAILPTHSSTTLQAFVAASTTPV